MKTISVEDFIWRERPVSRAQAAMSNPYDYDPVINPYNPVEIDEAYVIAKRYGHSDQTFSPYFPSLYFPSFSSCYYLYYYPYYYSKPYDFKLPYVYETYSAYTNADPDPYPEPTNPEPTPDPKPKPTPKPDWNTISRREKIEVILKAYLKAVAQQIPYFDLRQIFDNFPKYVENAGVQFQANLTINGQVVPVYIDLAIYNHMPIGTNVQPPEKLGPFSAWNPSNGIDKEGYWYSWTFVQYSTAGSNNTELLYVQVPEEHFETFKNYLNY